LEIPVFPSAPVRQDRVEFVAATALAAAIRAGPRKVVPEGSGFQFPFEDPGFGSDFDPPTFDL
jgi:hypothetical protein